MHIENMITTTKYRRPTYVRVVIVVSMLIMLVLLVSKPFFSGRNSTANNHNKNAHRYLQWKNSTTAVTTTTTNATTGDTDGDISADTILISLSILNTLLFVLPTSIRYTFQKRQCLRNPNDVNYNGCICSYPQLKYAIEQSNSNSDTFNDTSVFIICPATTINLEQPLDITNKKFRLTCGTSRFFNTDPCIISSIDSVNINHIFGAPNNVTIDDIKFFNGYATAMNGGNGASINMTGGYLTLRNVVFDSNFAIGYGGAIYVRNRNINTKATINIIGRTTFVNNFGDGSHNDIYIVPVASPQPLQSAFFSPGTVYIACIPTTLLNKPKFCNYNAMTSIVMENITQLSERVKYTNCDDTNLIETQC